MVFHPEVGRTIFDGLLLAGAEVRMGGILFLELFLLVMVDIYHEKNIQVSDWLDKQDKWFRWIIYLTMALFVNVGMVRDYGIDASTFIYANF